MEPAEDEFVDLEHLIVMRSIDVGVLADAIESVGIWGVDPFGRFRHFKPTEDGAKPAFDALAAQYSSSLYPDEQLAVESAVWERVFRSYGWLTKELPVLSPVARRLPGKFAGGPRGPALRAQKGNLRVIGALADLIVREPPDGKTKPNFERSEAKLIEHLVKLYDGYDGISKRTLEDKFADAKKVLENLD